MPSMSKIQQYQNNSTLVPAGGTPRESEVSLAFGLKLKDKLFQGQYVAN